MKNYDGDINEPLEQATWGAFSWIWRGRQFTMNRLGLVFPSWQWSDRKDEDNGVA